MKIICVICSELFTQSCNIFYTQCGHLFHYNCLTTWLERSRTCPQCREKVSRSRIHRIYFTHSNSEDVVDSSSSFQEKIDNLKFQLLVKEKDIGYFTGKNVTLEKQNAGLRKEVRKVESEMTNKNVTIHTLKEEVKSLRKQNMEYAKLKNEIVRLKKKNEELRNIQALLHASSTDVDDVIGQTRDPYKLIKYIHVLKRELLSSINKQKQLRIDMKKLQEDFTKISMDHDTSLLDDHCKIRQLEEKLAFCESTKMFYENRVHKLEEMLGIVKDKDSFPESSSLSKSHKHISEESLNQDCNKVKKRLENSTPKVQTDDHVRNSGSTSCLENVEEKEETENCTLPKTENTSALVTICQNYDLTENSYIASKKLKNSDKHKKMGLSNESTVGNEIVSINSLKRATSHSSCSSMNLKKPKNGTSKVKQNMNRYYNTLNDVIDLTN